MRDEDLEYVADLVVDALRNWKWILRYVVGYSPGPHWKMGPDDWLRVLSKIGAKLRVFYGEG